MRSVRTSSRTRARRPSAGVTTTPVSFCTNEPSGASAAQPASTSDAQQSRQNLHGTPLDIDSNFLAGNSNANAPESETRRRGGAAELAFRLVAGCTVAELHAFGTSHDASNFSRMKVQCSNENQDQVVLGQNPPPVITTELQQSMANKIGSPAPPGARKPPRAPAAIAPPPSKRASTSSNCWPPKSRR